MEEGVNALKNVREHQTKMVNMLKGGTTTTCGVSMRGGPAVVPQVDVFNPHGPQGPKDPFRKMASKEDC